MAAVQDKKKQDELDLSSFNIDDLDLEVESQDDQSIDDIISGIDLEELGLDLELEDSAGVGPTEDTFKIPDSTQQSLNIPLESAPAASTNVSVPVPKTIKGEDGEEISGVEDFGNALWKALGPNTVSLYQEVVGDHEGAEETLREAEKDFPTTGGFLSDTGETIGSIIPVAAALVAGTVSAPVEAVVGAAVLLNYSIQSFGEGRRAVRKFEEQTGEDISGLEELAVATGYASVTLISEKLGLKFLKGVGSKIAPKFLSRIGKAVAVGDSKAAVGLMLKGLRASGASSLIEGFEEVMEQGGKNAIDKVYDHKSVLDITDGLVDVLKSGLLGGGILGPLAIWANGKRRRLHSIESTNEAINANNEKRKGTRKEDVDIGETRKRLEFLSKMREADKDLAVNRKEGFARLAATEREVIRKLDEKPDNVEFREEEHNGQSFTEMYVANILGNEFEFSVDRSNGETVGSRYNEFYEKLIDIDTPSRSKQKLVKKLGNEAKAGKLVKKVVEIYHARPKKSVEKKLKNSKIRDERGNLMKVYTPSNISLVDPQPFNGNALYGEGFYFVTDPEVAPEYSQNLVSEEGILPIRAATLNIKNPFEINRKYTFEEISNIGGIEINKNGMTGREIWNKLVLSEKPGTDKAKIAEAKIKARGKLIGAGFDGITHEVSEGTDRPHTVVIAFNRGQMELGFESTKEAIERRKLSQPKTVPSEKSSSSVVSDAFPESLGGKREDGAKIIPPEAEARPHLVREDVRMDIERRFNELPISIKDWNRTMEPYLGKNKMFSNRFAEWWKTGLMDTALFFSKTHGPGGGKLFQHAIEGWDEETRLHQIGMAILDEASILAEDIKENLGEREKNKSLERVARALQNRRQADRILVSEQERSLFDIFQKGYDLYKGELEARGIETVEDYFTRVANQVAIVEDIFASEEALGSEFGKAKSSMLDDAISGKARSRFLKKRTGELKDQNLNAIEVFRIYSSSVSKALAYRNFMKYYLGDFINDVPKINQRSKDFRIFHKEMVGWIRGFLDQEYVYGSQSSRIFVNTRFNIYRNLLMFNFRASWENLTQKSFARAFVGKEFWGAGNELYRTIRKAKRAKAKGEATLYPRLQSVIDEAAKDKVYLMDMLNIDLERAKRQGKVTRNMEVVFTKLQEIDPFRLSEKSNWDYAEALGIAEMLMKQEEFKKLKKKGLSDLDAMEQMLADKDLAYKAKVNAQALSQQTQFMPGVVAAPKWFRGKAGATILMFQRFPVGQLENIILSFKGGSKGAAALRILRRGFDEEVGPVLELKRVEAFSEAIDEAIRAKLANPSSANFSTRNALKLKKAIKSIETDLNNIVSKIQPINKNNKKSQAALWTKYVSKRMLLHFTYNVFANVLADASGIGASEKEKKKGIVQRSFDSAWKNIIPFYYQARDPSRLLHPPIIPDISNTKRTIRWGFNVIPYIGIVDRLTGRIASDSIAEMFSSSDNSTGWVRVDRVRRQSLR